MINDEIQARLASSVEKLRVEADLRELQEREWSDAWKSAEWECYTLWPSEGRNLRIINLAQPDLQVWLALGRLLIERDCVKWLLRFSEDGITRGSTLAAGEIALLDIVQACCRVPQRQSLVQETLDKYCQIEAPLAVHDAIMTLRGFVEQLAFYGGFKPWREEVPAIQTPKAKEPTPRSLKVKHIIKLFASGIDDVDAITERVGCSAEQVRRVKCDYSEQCKPKSTQEKK